MIRRSQLYVPANDTKKVMKVPAIPCDSVILDLEDAVPHSEKGIARSRLAWLVDSVDWGRKELCVRINELSSQLGRLDLEAVKKIDRIDAIVIPKAEGRLSDIAKSSKSLIPIIETARGLLTIESLAASKGVIALAYGAADFALSVGGTVSEYLGNTFVKTKIAVSASAAGLDAIDNVFFDLGDQVGFKREAERSRAIGYSGKQVIHPSQVEVANKVFSPTRDEVKWAKDVVKAYNEVKTRGRGAIKLDSKLVDAVHVRHARRILEWNASIGAKGR